MTEATEFEWVDEIPARRGGGRPGSGKWNKMYEMLSNKPGKIAKLGPFTPGTASGVSSRLKKLGATTTSQSVDAETAFVYAYVAGDEELPESEHNSESMFDGEDSE